jgi:hypothetical protein
MGWKEWSFFAILLGLGDLAGDVKPFYTYSPHEISIRTPILSTFSLPSILALDEENNKLIQQRATSKATPTRVRAYLYSAACDFGCLTKGRGDLETLSHEVLRIFFADLPKKKFSDPLSEKIGNQVLLVYQTRFNAEEKRLQPALIKRGDNFWKPKGGEAAGLYEGSASPWYIESAKIFSFRPLPAPDSAYWQDQLEQLKESKGEDEEEKKGLSQSLNNDAWQNLLKEAARKENVDPLTYLYERALLERTLHDTSIVVFEGKYKIGARRPEAISKGLTTLIPTPAHPSYPSLFSAQASAANTLLSVLYPKQRQQWEKTAQTAAESRVLAGIHFPIDHEEGLRIGRLVAQKALREEK